MVTVLHSGTTTKYSENWDQVFGTRKKRSTGPAKKKAAAKKQASTKKKSAVAKKSGKKASGKKKSARR